MIVASLAEVGGQSGSIAHHSILRKKITLSKSLLVSIGLHALLVMPVLVFQYMTPAPVKEKMLVVDMSGMESTWQVVKKDLGEEVDRKTPDLQKTKAAPTPPQPKIQSIVESPVHIEKKEDQKEVTQEQQVANTNKGTSEQREQQTLRDNNQERDVLLRYVMAATRAIKSKLVYPPDARQASYAGLATITTIGFSITLDGQIEPGTLAVRTSSGYPLLDESALRAARAAVPLPPPPRTMSVTIPIAFTEGRK